ncbi:MAG: hypothetical protein WBC37_11295, partial [Burkholderiaceae bacterium]
MTIQRLRLLVGVAFAVMTGSASADLIFDNSGVKPTFFQEKDDERSPLAVITVGQDTTINQIGALVDFSTSIG